MKILLFDMDGVLLESQGYHRALQETVRRMALALGFDGQTLTAADIAAFEAGGITSEWDEAAIATAALLEIVWKDEPDRPVPDSLSTPAAPGPRRLPDLASLAGLLSAPGLLALHPLERAARFFFNKPYRSPTQENILHQVILGARSAEFSLTHRTFQELVLGSREFERCYPFPSVLDSGSYLLEYDRSNLTPEESAAIQDWLSEAGHSAAVITSRPSSPPQGVFSTPEAELGLRLVGLEGLPILGWGGMCWLGLKTYRDPQTFLKPSPVHALAGMRMACGEGQEAALPAAVALATFGQLDDGWERFQEAEVRVFEDTPGGVRSLRAAAETLASAGIHISTRFFGIARQPVKVAALESLGAKVFPSLSEALSPELYK